MCEVVWLTKKQMAKMDGEGEDKGQLNYHVILIGKTLLFMAQSSS